MKNKLDILESALTQRDDEIFGYQLNIDNYTRMIASLPSVWPEDLLHCRGTDIPTIIQTVEDDDMRVLIADLIFRDKLVTTLITEKLEQRKAILVREVVEAQIKELTCST
jgi:hypothetical protein